MRTERPRKTKIGTEVAHVTRDSDTTFKVKGQGHQAALLSAALTRAAGAAVTVRTYWAWGTTATLRLLGGARGAGAPTGGRRRAGAYRGDMLDPSPPRLLLQLQKQAVREAATIGRRLT